MAEPRDYGQPTAYATLANHHTSPHLDWLNEQLREAHQVLAGRMSGFIGQALMQAYTAGLRDGFQQGVEAECQAREGSDG